MAKSVQIPVRFTPQIAERLLDLAVAQGRTPQDLVRQWVAEKLGPTAVDEEKGPWCCTQMTCRHCGHAWVGVHPLGAGPLECPVCHKGTPAPLVVVP